MIDAAKLKSYVERVERLDTEQATVGLDKRAVFDEAKTAGINTKMLRRYLAERKRDAKDSATDKETLDSYRALLEAPGSTYRGVAAQVGLSKTKLQRLVPKRENGTTESCGGTLSDRASETLEATVSEGDVAPASSAKGTDGSATSDAGTPSGDFADPAVTDVASRCEPGPQEPDWDAIVASQPPQLRRVSA